MATVSSQFREQEAPLLPGQSSIARSEAEDERNDICLIDDHNSQNTVLAYRDNAMTNASAFVIQLASIALVISICTLVLWTMPLSPLPLFGYHPMVQSVAFLSLMQSTLTLQPTSMSRPKEKQAAFQVHRFFNLLLVLPLFTIGASIMWYLHDQPGSTHFVSLHGILGTTCLLWAWLQVAVGILVTAFQGKLVGNTARAKSLYKWHRLSGYVLMLLIVFTVYLGTAHTSWSVQNGSSPFRAAIVFLLIIITGTTIVRTQRSKMPSHILANAS